MLTRAARPEHDRAVQDGAEAAISCLTAAVPSLTTELVKQFSNSMPQTSIALGNLNVVLANRLVDLSSREQTDAALSVRSLLLNNLGGRLQQAGRDGEALIATEEAVASGGNSSAGTATRSYQISRDHFTISGRVTPASAVMRRRLPRPKSRSFSIANLSARSATRYSAEFGLALTIHGINLVQLDHRDAGSPRQKSL